MIHQIDIPTLGHTYIIRFPTEKLGDARFKLWLLADARHIHMHEFCEAARQLKEIEDRDMSDMEALKKRLIRAGFYPVFAGYENDWQVTLNHSFPSHELHRPPFGRAATIQDAVTAAEVDLQKMLDAKRAKSA